MCPRYDSPETSVGIHGATVDLHMILEIDNQWSTDMGNDWGAGGHICHVDIYQIFLQKLKEEGILLVDRYQAIRSVSQKRGK